MFVEQSRVLFVDLDGTLIKTDLLWESFIAAIKADLRVMLQVPGWLREGRAVLKEQLSEAGKVDVASLPYRAEVVDFLRAQRAKGCRIVLATAATRSVALAVADELQLFDEVLASDGTSNLKGRAKLAAINEYCDLHGFEEFGYIGDAHADLAIWEHAEQVYAAAPSARLSAQLQKFDRPVKAIGAAPSRARGLLKAMRPKQWAKNLLLFVPLIMAHRVLDISALALCVLGFIAFSLCASSIYVVNDLMDVVADRHHPVKRRRPFAAGTIPLAYGLPLSAALATLGLSIAALLPLKFFACLVVYLVVTCIYTFKAKKLVAVDVTVLAGLYAIRVIAGGLATGVEVSQWLIAFSMFLFLSLAFAKRHSELVRLRNDGDSEAKGRAYVVDDAMLVQNLGSVSGYLAVLVLALYVNSEPMQATYSNPWPLWGICPLLLYWVSRLWFLSARGQLSEDPVAFALTDRVSLGVGATTALLLVAATFIPA